MLPQRVPNIKTEVKTPKMFIIKQLSLDNRPQEAESLHKKELLVKYDLTEERLLFFRM